MSIKKHSNDDRIYCKSVAKSISDIIRFSLDEDFRKNSFEIFGVRSTKDTEREIKKRLFFLTQSDNKTIRSQQLTVKNEIENISKRKEIADKENVDGQNDSQKDTVLTSSTTTDSNSQNSQTMFKRNWLQISSQQCREVIKRKKLQCYSQPQFGQRTQNELEFFSCRAYSIEVPHSLSSSSLFSEERTSSSEFSNNSTNYFKEKFKSSFKENSEKYFTINFKPHKFPPEPDQKFSF